jgi:pseudouridine kinase
VIGGANVDVKARSTAPLIPATSNPGHASIAAGGVGRNVAENLARLGHRTFLVSAVGRDANGDFLLAHTADAGVHLEFVHRTDTPTGTYVAVLEASGELAYAVADMSATAELGIAEIERAHDVIASAQLVVLDGNLAASALAHALRLTAACRVRTVLDPVSVAKAAVLAPQLQPDRPLFAVTPNRDELAALSGMPTRTDDEVRAAVAHLHARGAAHVWVRLGQGGSLLSDGTDVSTFTASAAPVVDVTGAGDAMLAAFCHGLLDGGTITEAVRSGHAAAALTVASEHTVRPDLTRQLLQAALTDIVKE